MIGNDWCSLHRFLNIFSKRHLDFYLSDIFKQFIAIFIAERSVSSCHFKDQDTQTPPINHFIIALLQKNFWGQIFGRSAYTHSLLGCYSHITMDLIKLSLLVERPKSASFKCPFASTKIFSGFKSL